MHYISIQQAADKSLVPKITLLRSWAKTALNKKLKTSEVTIRIVDIKEMSTLNQMYRRKEGPTNVLSFPFNVPKGVDIKIPILGDIVICAEIVKREADEQQKALDAHWAHMVIHGIFHLLGYDHEKDDDANIMEALEIETLQSLGFDNPYHTGDDIKKYD